MLTPAPCKSVPVSERNVLDMAHEYAKLIVRAKDDKDFPLTAHEEREAIKYLMEVW